MKLLVMFAGPHGSGKSSAFKEACQGSHLPSIRINPDAFVSDTAFAGQPRLALAHAAQVRTAALARGDSFAIETISSISILREAKALDYTIKLVFFTTCDPEINKTRVKRRALEKGHNIPPEKILDGYARSMRELAEAVSIADEALVFDNSVDRTISPDITPLLVLKKQSGEKYWLIPSPDRPAWVETYLVSPLTESGELPVATDLSRVPSNI